MSGKDGRIRIVELGADFPVDEVRGLFLEYADTIGIDLSFQDFESELENLPGEYAPPHGGLFIAYDGDEAAACVAVRMISLALCEMKRLYVRIPYRRLGLGRRLAEAAVSLARRIGYARMRLDTLSSMEPATALYRSMGFTDIEPYRFNPIEGTIYLELEL